MRVACVVVASILTALGTMARAADEIPNLDEIPLLRDAQFFETAAVPEIPAAAESAEIGRMHPLMRKSSLFRRTASQKSVEADDSIFSGRPRRAAVHRSHRSDADNSGELLPTLRATSATRGLLLPTYRGTNPPETPALLPTDRPVILQSDFREFPPLQ